MAGAMGDDITRCAIFRPTTLMLPGSIIWWIRERPGRGGMSACHARHTEPTGSPRGIVIGDYKVTAIVDTVFYPEDDRFLLERDPPSSHEVVQAHFRHVSGPSAEQRECRHSIRSRHSMRDSTPPSVAMRSDGSGVRVAASGIVAVGKFAGLGRGLTHTARHAGRSRDGDGRA